ncbi:hypothetical protein [Erythrobacter oryzae]|uniref:hypothetical protein n=1 Tax=Erythrobacter oryzae TaxID=3019556 RepID=UPI0025534445|nr:hypothetical protein [Erythrobacter sp. COR-2]
MSAGKAARAVGLAMALAACGSEPRQDEPAAPGPDATAALRSESPAPATSPAAADAIPARFLGVWDAETGTCDPASDLRLDITPQAIGFYESHGTLTRIAETLDGLTVVELAMEGEGETWVMTMTIGLRGAGAAERLVVQHKGEPGRPVPEPLTLKRCPA